MFPVTLHHPRGKGISLILSGIGFIVWVVATRILIDGPGSWLLLLGDLCAVAFVAFLIFAGST